MYPNTYRARFPADSAASSVEKSEQSADGKTRLGVCGRTDVICTHTVLCKSELWTLSSRGWFQAMKTETEGRMALFQQQNET